MNKKFKHNERKSYRQGFYPPNADPSELFAVHFAQNAGKNRLNDKVNNIYVIYKGEGMHFPQKVESFTQNTRGRGKFEKKIAERC